MTADGKRGCWIPVRGTWETQYEAHDIAKAEAAGKPAPRLRWYRRGSTFCRFLSSTFGLELLDFDGDPETRNTPLWSGALQGTLLQAVQGWMTRTRKADWQNGGARIQHQIRRAVEAGFQRIVIVAFSHGGQAAAYALATLPPHVGLKGVDIALVTVDTPIRGNQLAWYDRARKLLSGHVHFHTTGLKTWVRWTGARSFRCKMRNALNIPASGHGDPLYDLAAHATAWLRALRHLGFAQIPADAAAALDRVLAERGEGRA